VAKCHNLDEIWQFAEHIRSLRSSLPFDIDGIVIKLDAIKEQNNLGVAGKNPRWAVAYKFAAEQALTRIHAITVQVGRTGVLTPVAELDPIFLAGSTISRATLHNEEEVQRKDIRVGDYVYIEKGGDVIPKVDRVDMTQRPSDSHPWKMPTHCPTCGSSVVRIQGEVAVRCPNAENCRDQQLLRIVYFASKPAMDIDNLGEKVIQHLFDKGFIRHPSDIYKLTAEQLYQIPNFKDKSVQNLLGAIERSREVPLDKFIMALGIKYVGQGTAEDLAKASGDIHSLVNMSYEDLLKIEGVGEKVASAIIEHFKDPLQKKELDLLLNNGVKPTQKQLKQRITNHVFNGKNFVLTGSLKKYKRTEAVDLIKERGGKVTDSVTKKTNYLLVGEDPGSKLDKARDLSVEILTEEKFNQLL
jgi:DNA ligase (NAD+)